MSQSKIKPDYYTAPNGMEVLDFTNAFNLNFNLGNVVKYIVRAGHKEGEDAIEAINKANMYLMQELLRVAKNEAREQAEQSQE